MFHLSCGGDDPDLVGYLISAWAFHCRESHEGEGGGAENPSGRLGGRQGSSNHLLRGRLGGVSLKNGDFF
jgi:hypothetical protein